MKHSSNVLARFFAGVTESTFQSQLGVADPNLIDYLSGLLMRFVRNDAVHRVRNLTGRKLTDVGQMVAEANQRVGSARRKVHRQIGDFSEFTYLAIIAAQP